jgi:hypothetical protein
MSNKHKNYGQYYNNRPNNGGNNQGNNKPVVEETVLAEAPVADEVPVVEPVVEETITNVVPESYSVDLSVAPVEPVIDADPRPDLPPEITGVVTGCVKLNVRAEADSEAPVVVVINAGATVEIFPMMETKDFYNVCTETGAKGYCMKKFIAVNPK